MPRLRGLIMAAAVCALALGSLGVPTAALDPTVHVAVVNGIPGKAVDVCLSGQEVRSSLRYGRSVAKTRPAGTVTLKIAIAAPGRCKGTELFSGPFPSGTDFTVVTTAKAPGKIMPFNNVGLGTIDTSVTDHVGIVWRHAADVGDVLWVVQLDEPITPSALPPLWQKGDSAGVLSVVDVYLSIVHWVTKVGKNRPLAGPVRQNLAPNRRYEIYLLGTNATNARIVTLVRKILPAP